MFFKGVKAEEYSVNDNIFLFRQPRVQQRRGGKDRAGSVAAGIADEPGRLDFGFVPLRQAVDRNLQQIRPGVRRAVPLFVHLHVVVAEIARQVDDARACVVERRDHRARCAVRKRGEDHVTLLCIRFHIQRSQLFFECSLQRRIEIADLFSLMGLRG